MDEHHYCTEDDEREDANEVKVCINPCRDTNFSSRNIHETSRFEKEQHAVASKIKKHYSVKYASFVYLFDAFHIIQLLRPTSYVARI